MVEGWVRELSRKMGQQEKTKGKRDGQYRLESQREEDKNGIWLAVAVVTGRNMSS